jgi:TolB-like protein/Tfp pilus assembly protein PilF
VIAVLCYVLITQIKPTGKIEIKPTGEIEWKDSIAVLPIEDRSEDKDQGPVCDGMTFDIIGKLYRIKGLRVVTYRTMDRYKDVDLTSKEVGKLLGVTKILESYLDEEDNKIQVKFHLIDANEDYVIESFKYPEDLGDIISIQNSLTRDIAKTLKLPLVGERFEERKKIDPKDTKAYYYYISGKGLRKKYEQSYEESDFVSAKKMYEEAIRIDQDYARAYFGLGILHEVKYNINKKPEDLLSMYENLKKAHDINPNLAESRVGLGWAYFYKRDYDKAFKYFKSALEIKPYNSEVNRLTAAFLLSIGLNHQAIKFCSKAVELDPLYFWNHYILAACFMYVGDYDKAANHFRSALDIDPTHLDLLSRYAYLLILKKNIEEAEKILEIAEKIDEEDYWRIRHARALLLAIKGKKEEALKLIEDRPYLYLATSIYSHLGMNDEAVTYIREGIEKGSRELNIYLYPYPFLMSNPFYDNIRDDPSFQEIVKEEKEKYEKKRKKYGKL